MSKETKHTPTPTPWKVMNSHKAGFYANAALIVRAVNSYADLLAALERIVSDGECYCADYVATCRPCGWCVARAALAKAQKP